MSDDERISRNPRVLASIKPHLFHFQEAGEMPTGSETGGGDQGDQTPSAQEWLAANGLDTPDKVAQYVMQSHQALTHGDAEFKKLQAQNADYEKKLKELQTTPPAPTDIDLEDVLEDEGITKEDLADFDKADRATLARALAAANRLTKNNPGDKKAQKQALTLFGTAVRKIAAKAASKDKLSAEDIAKIVDQRLYEGFGQVIAQQELLSSPFIQEHGLEGAAPLMAKLAKQGIPQEDILNIVFQSKYGTNYNGKIPDDDLDRQRKKNLQKQAARLGVSPDSLELEASNTPQRKAANRAALTELLVGRRPKPNSGRG